MATLVVHVKTESLPLESFDQQTRDSISSWSKPEEIRYSPSTAKIIELSLYDIERKQGVVYSTKTDSEIPELADWSIKAGTEKEILEDFWEGAKSYDIFVTFNGRAFTIPFLLHRSIAHKVKPSVEIARQRYITKQSSPYHVDLMDEFSFYGAMKRPSLHMLCQLYEIKEEKDLCIIKDTNNIAALYEVWKAYLAPIAFINAIEF